MAANLLAESASANVGLCPQGLYIKMREVISREYLEPQSSNGLAEIDQALRSTFRACEMLPNNCGLADSDACGGPEPTSGFIRTR